MGPAYFIIAIMGCSDAGLECRTVATPPARYGSEQSCRAARGDALMANTDLDFQLKQHGIEKVVVVGMLANTCIESTGKFAAELGYHVTLVRDATAAFSAEAMHAAHEINGPTYAHAIVSTSELLAALHQDSASRF